MIRFFDSKLRKQGSEVQLEGLSSVDSGPWTIFRSSNLYFNFTGKVAENRKNQFPKTSLIASR